MNSNAVAWLYVRVEKTAKSGDNVLGNPHCQPPIKQCYALLYWGLAMWVSEAWEWA